MRKTVTSLEQRVDAFLAPALLNPAIDTHSTKRDNTQKGADPHNARPTYHYLMLRALANLLAVLPRNTPDYTVIATALARGLRARNSDFARGNAIDCENALVVTEALLNPADASKQKNSSLLRNEFF